MISKPSIFKPMIASSLALALGVSVVSAEVRKNAIVTQDVMMYQGGTIDNAHAVETNDSRAGLIIRAEELLALSLVEANSNLTITQITSANKNAYGILIDEASQSYIGILSMYFPILSITENPITTKEGGESYIYANKSNQGVGIMQVRLVAGVLPQDESLKHFALYVGLDDSRFDFGTQPNAYTRFGIHQSTDLTGIYIAGNTSFTGNLVLSRIEVMEPTQGGNAYGIVAYADGKTLTLDNASIVFEDIVGSQVASGIYLDGDKGLTLSGNGKIVFEKVRIGQGGNAYIINNASTGKALSLKGVSIISGTALSSGLTELGTFGIQNTMDGAVYNFGSGKASTSFAAFASNTAANDTKGKDSVGLLTSENMTLSGNLSFEGVVAQAGGTGGVSGNAYGIVHGTNGYENKTITLKDANITFANITAGNGGNAFGIYLDDTAHPSLTISGSGNLIFTNITAGVSGKQAVERGIASARKGGVAYIIKNPAAETLTLSGVSVVAGSADKVNGSYGIYSNLDGATYRFGRTILKMNDAQANTAGSTYTGMIVKQSLYAFGTLQVEGQNANGAGDGLKGGDVSGVHFASGQFDFDKLTLNVIGGSGSNGSSRAVAGNGGDAYGVTASGGTLSLAKGASKITATGGTGGVQGNAYAVYTLGDFTISGYMASQDEGVRRTLSLEANGNNAYGIYLAGKGEADRANILDVQALALVGADATTGAIQGNQAYGIYNAEKGWNKLLGNITLGDDTNVVIGNDTASGAYGLYNQGKLELGTNTSIEFKDHALKAKTDDKAVHLYNAGDLTFDATSKVFIGTSADVNTNLYAGASKTLNVVFGANSTTTFKRAAAIGGSGTINVTMEKGSKAIFEKTAFASGTGAINLSLGEKSTLIFGGDAGEVNTLSGSNADIFLAGKDGEAVDIRLKQQEFKRRMLIVDDMQLSDSHIVLAAKTESVDDIDPKVIVSDTITVTTTSQNILNNTLHIMVDQYAQTNQNRVAILAITDKDSKVIFNNLKTDGKVNASVFSGFTNGDVAIERITVGEYSYYTSDLKTTNLSINSDFVAPTTAALSAGVSLFSANLNSLSKRMGELRNDPHSQGVWTRVFGGEMSTDFGAKQSTVYSTIQAGYDYKLAFEGANNYIGAAVSYTKGSGGQVKPAFSYVSDPLNQVIAGLSSSNTDGVEVALYNSYVAASGLYSDTIAKFGYYANEITMFMQPDSYKTSNFAAAISEEVGYKFNLGANNEWFITPQGEIAYAYIGGTDFTQTMLGNTMKSTQDAVSLLRSRIGAAWGYDFSHLAKESNVKASVYLGTYYAYDYFIGGDTTLSTTLNNKVVDFKHNAYEGTGRFVMNLGTNIDVQESTKVYFDFEKSFGGKIQTDYQVSLGVRFGFGEKVSAPKAVEKKASETALKPKELEETQGE